MMSGKFHHFGVPTTTKQENETYLEDLKLHITSPDDHPYKVEFLRFEESSPMPEQIRSQCHAAFEVENIDEAIKGYKVILAPLAVSPALKIAFIMDDRALIELMQTT